MTNYQKIQVMNIKELNKLLLKLDSVGIRSFCDNLYCADCKNQNKNLCEESCVYEDIDTINWWLTHDDN